MCKPVIFDDGGSLRIREMEDDKFMDGLISPPSKAVPSNQNFFDKGTNKFVCTLTVRYLDEDGVFRDGPSGEQSLWARSGSERHRHYHL